MSAAGMPRELGNSLVSNIAKVTHTTKDMTPDQLKGYGYTKFQKLGKAFGTSLGEQLHSAAKNILRSKGIGETRSLPRC